MRIVLIGTVVFSREMLSHLITSDADVVGVCTSDTSCLNSDFADLGPVCESHAVPMYRCSDINSKETIDWIKGREPDVIFCFGWSRLVGRDILSLPPMGVVGYHPSALPENRGRHPLIWALALGLKRTASSFFLMDEGADSGDILSQVPVFIRPDDDAGLLYQKMLRTACEQLTDLVRVLENGCAQRYKQDGSKATTWRKRSVADGLIDWRMPANGIYNLVRALSHPYPGATFSTRGSVVTVWKAKIVSDAPANAEPGKVVSFLGGKPVIRCGDYAICLLLTEPDFVPSLGDYV